MGQRSQIYIRINDIDNNTTLFAKYFGWNFGERMISRARYGIEYIKDNLKYLDQKWVREKINRIFDVNFDMNDIQETDDILEEVRNGLWEDRKLANEYIFLEQDNNDGKLFIDCNQKNREIKFCFTDRKLNILSPNEYMIWNIGENWTSSNFFSDPELDENWKNVIPVCKENIEILNKFEMMDAKELDSFIKADYSKQIGDSKFKVLLKDFVEKGMKYDKFWCYIIEKINNKGSWKLYEIDSNKILMRYDANTNELKIDESFKDYKGLIQDVQEYYNIQDKEESITCEEEKE